MANGNEALVARVVLREARTYNVRGRRWIKDVPGVVKGSAEIKPYQDNGYFHVTVLKSGPAEEAPSKVAETPVAAKQPAKPVALKKK